MSKIVRNIPDGLEASYDDFPDVVRYVDTIADLANVDANFRDSGGVVIVKDNIGGGHHFIYEPGIHDGVTFYADSVSIPTDWNDQAQLLTFFTPSTSNENGWKRIEKPNHINHAGGDISLQSSALQDNALTLALHKLGGGEINYGNGIYLYHRAIRNDTYSYMTESYIVIGGIVEPLSFIHRKGNNTTIKPTEGNSIISSFPEPHTDISGLTLSILSNGIRLSNLTLDGDYDNIPEYGLTYGEHYENHTDSYYKNSIYACDNYQYGFYGYRAKNIIIDSTVTIKNQWYNGVELYLCDTFEIYATLDHCGDKPNFYGLYSAIETDNSTQNGIISINVKNSGKFLLANGDTSDYALNPVRNIEVTKCIVDNISDIAIDLINWIDNYHIHDNIFDNLQKGFGTVVRTDGVPNYGRNPINVNIHDNEVKDFNQSNIEGSVGIRFGAESGKIHNNTFKTNSNVKHYGVILSQDNIDSPSIELFDNVIEGNFIGDNDNHAAITLESAGAKCKRNKMIGNSTIGIHATQPGVLEDNEFNGTFSQAKEVFHADPTLYRGNPTNIYAKCSSTLAGVSGWNIVPVLKNIDTRDEFDDSTHQFICQIPGLYRITYAPSFYNATSQGLSIIEQNGVSVMSINVQIVDTSVTTNMGQGIVQLNKGDTILMKMYSANSFDIYENTYMQIEYINN